jgi:hypothetical protein
MTAKRKDEKGRRKFERKNKGIEKRRRQLS